MKQYSFFILFIILFDCKTTYSQIKKPVIMTPIQEFFSHVGKIIPHYRKSCTKGYTKEELLEFEKKIGFKLPDAVKEFYETIRGDQMGLANGWCFMPLINEELPYYFSGSFVDNPKKVKPIWNSKKRFPVITDNGGSVIYLDCDPDKEGTFGQLILVFRDDPEIVFSVANNFESFIIFLNNEFKSKRVKDDSSPDFTYLAFINSGNLEPWVTLSRSLSGQISSTSNEKLSLDSSTKEAIKYGFLKRKAVEDMTYSDVDRVYSLIIRDNNLENLEPLTLFPNIAKVQFYFKDSITIPNRLWDILQKTRVSDISFVLNNHSLKLVDSEGILKLKTLSKLSLIFDSKIENINLLTQLTELRNLELNQECDLSFLKGMPNLFALDLRKDSVNYQNWEVISSLHELTNLSIPMSNFSEISLLVPLTKLQHLSLGNSLISNTSAFENLPSKLWIGCSYDLFEKIFDIAIKKQFTFESFYSQPTKKQEELYEKYRKIRETWK
jgi:cell wall assembly regulator SMI1